MDISRRIHRTTVFVHLEVHVWAGRAAAGAHQSDDLAFFDHITDFDQVFFVVRIARGKTAAMIDFHHLAVAMAILRPGNHTGGHRDDFGAVFTGKIHATVPRHLTGEWVGATAKARGHPAFLDRATGDKDVVLQLALGQQGIQGGELLFAVLDLIGQLIDHADEIGGGVGITDGGGFRATQGGRLTEVKLTFIQVGEAGQVLTQRIQTHQTGL